MNFDDNEVKRKYQWKEFAEHIEKALKEMSKESIVFKKSEYIFDMFNQYRIIEK